jgi:hypothetical protein
MARYQHGDILLDGEGWFALKGHFSDEEFITRAADQDLKAKDGSVERTYARWCYLHNYGDEPGLYLMRAKKGDRGVFPVTWSEDVRCDV